MLIHNCIVLAPARARKSPGGAGLSKKPAATAIIAALAAPVPTQDLARRACARRPPVSRLHPIAARWSKLSLTFTD